MIKFLLHSASYLWFLITLLGESITMELYRDKFASRQQNILHSSFHMVWVVGGSALLLPCDTQKKGSKSGCTAHVTLSHAGFFWYECKEVWIEGLRSYFLDWWNCLDVMVLSMYLASFALRVLIMLKGHFLCQDHSGAEECVYFTETGERDSSASQPVIRRLAELVFSWLGLSCKCVTTGIRRIRS